MGFGRYIAQELTGSPAPLIPEATVRSAVAPPPAGPASTDLACPNPYRGADWYIRARRSGDAPSRYARRIASMRAMVWLMPLAVHRRADVPRGG